MLQSALPHSAPPPSSDLPATLPPTPRSKLMPPPSRPPAPGEDLSIYGVRPDEPPAEEEPHPLKVFRDTSDISETMPPRAPRPAERPGGRSPGRPPAPGGAPPPRRPEEPPPIAETMPPPRACAP